MLRAQQPDLKLPTLEGVSFNGRLAIVYSRFGLSTEWDGQDRPYALCYEPTDSRQLGLNVLIYAMTH